MALFRNNIFRLVALIVFVCYEVGKYSARARGSQLLIPVFDRFIFIMSNANGTSADIDPQKEERAGKVREVGSHAIWSLSSCKPSFGVDQLRDNCMETYWQSDGQLPHLVNIQFRKKTTVQDICIYIDYKLDESYTPSRISVRAGTNFTDLQEVEVIDLNEPTGWFVIPIKDIHDKPIRTFMIQIAVISNHQNGRDTHMRQIKIHSPMEKRGTSINDLGDFSTNLCQMFSSVR